MRRLLVSVLPLVAAVLFLVPQTASAQVGSIAGVVRDASGAVLPGVTVEVTSPALIEKTRSTTTDNNGRYQITALSVGSYSVTLTLSGFSTFKRENVIVTSDFTATVNAEMTVGGLKDTVNVTAEAPIVNTTTASVQQVLQGAEIADLPTQRDIPSLLNLVPGFQSSALRGACDGGVGVFCNPTVPLFNSHTSASDTDGQNQGRIMVDGMSINMGRSGVGINENVGQANGIVLNTAAAQEVSFTLSGSLGESETGGAAINIVPRTGGNRFSGGYALTYANTSMFDRNTGTRLTWSPTLVSATNPTGRQIPGRNAFVYDYDMTGTFGGPVKKDRMWFYLQARKQERQQWPGGDPGYLNKNEGLFGANYEPLRDCSSVPRDCKDGQLTYTNLYQNASARLTIQASQKNKVNVYWDEQDACTNPCYGMISNINSPESYFTLQSRPNRLIQLSWTNPFTNRLLFDAGISAVLTHQDQTRSREFTNPRGIPRICETGTTVGLDDVASRVNTTNIPFNGTVGACGVFTTFGSGSVNDSAPSSNPFLNTPNQLLRDKTYRSRASASYITGTHNVKVGYEGAYFGERTRNEANDLRLNYHYGTPVTAGAWNNTTRTGNCKDPNFDFSNTPYPCGNMALYYPDDPNNSFLRPIPVGVDVNTGEAELDERVWFGALYAQDQWTYNRFTLNGALRYDHAQSRYGATCVGPDIYVPTQWCTTAQDAANYNDFTPRWGVAWDVFGNGKTSIKWNMGKYLQAAGLGGNYTGFNDARRANNQLTRGWNDLNGNRVFECDMTNPNAYYTNSANPASGDFCGSMLGTNGLPSANFLTFGQPPTGSALANTTAPCGFQVPHATETQVDYCNLANQNLMDGWGKRRNEWQFGLGIQHEVLPRMSVEVTYNRRKYGNLTDTDTVALGCDYFQTTNATTGQPNALDANTCIQGYQSYTDPTGLRDFYTLQVPTDPRLPDGGGYVIRGLTNQHSNGALPVGQGGVVLIRDQLSYTWAGFDTNVVMRARGGLRLSGGTSTGRAKRNTCDTAIDTPNVKGRVGNELGGGCINNEPFLTNVRGNISYTIPWIDVLASGVFQYRPGVARTATMTINSKDVVWEPASAARQGGQFNSAFGSVATLANINLLDNNDLYGEGMRLFDLTFRKNVRFAGKRLALGLDIYNLFNSDAALGYQNAYQMFNVNGVWQQDDPSTPQVEVNDWGRVTSVTNPRFARFSLTFDF
jgi:hypothetical protein